MKNLLESLEKSLTIKDGKIGNLTQPSLREGNGGFWDILHLSKDINSSHSVLILEVLMIFFVDYWNKIALNYHQKVETLGIGDADDVFLLVDDFL